MMTTNRRVPLIAAGAALLLIVIWYLTLWAPQAKKLQAAHKAHSAAVQKVASLQSQEGQLRGLVKQIPADNARFAQLEAALPNNPQLDQALVLIQQAAVASGVSVMTLAPGSPNAASSSGPKTGEPAITLSLSVHGNPAQVTSFLAALASLPRTVVVNSVSIAGGSSSSATIQAAIFYAGQPTP
jgi:Tfp pilus assembly protein PilO